MAGAGAPHGGMLALARRRYPEAPEPLIDLSTGINTTPYPIGVVPQEAYARLPDPEDLARLEQAAARAYGAADRAAMVAAPGTQILISLLPRLLPDVVSVAVLSPTYGEHEAAWRDSGAAFARVRCLGETGAARCVVLVNPNNPDGRRIAPAALLGAADRLAARDGLLVVDEAFMDFEPPGMSVVPALPHPAILVLRSFGKPYGLAGLRLGFAIGTPAMAEFLRRALGPWAVSGAAIRVGCQALADVAWRAASTTRLAEGAARLDAVIGATGMILVGGTSLFRLYAGPGAARLQAHLGAAGIVVRGFAGHAEWLRLGIPAPADWTRLEAALARFEAGMMRLVCRQAPGAEGFCSYRAELPPALRGRWCLLHFGARIVASGALVRLRIAGAAEGFGCSTEHFMTPAGGRLAAVIFIPDDFSHVVLDLYGDETPPASIELCTRTLGRAAAAGLLMAWRPRRFTAALRRPGPSIGARIRSALFVIATRPEPPGGYADWIRLFDTWHEVRVQALLGSPRRLDWPTVHAVVFTNGAAPSAIAATVASLAQSAVAIGWCAAGDDLPDTAACGYVAILQAGEVLPPHAIALASEHLARSGMPKALLADEDALDPAGARCAPMFKPGPSRLAMLSGTMTRGAWLVRRDVYFASLPQSGWAEVARLRIWLALFESGQAGSVVRVAHVLTHLRPDAGRPPAEALGAEVAAHLRRCSPGATVDVVALPLVVRLAPPRLRICIVVLTAARRPHVAECLAAVLATTDWPELELLLVLTQAAEPDAAQDALLRPILADRRVRLLHNRSATFNFAGANNVAVRATDAPVICLLNDDVAPMAAGWLAAMAGHLDNPQVAAVGAKLYYANRTVQHGGIVMGLGGLCEHAYRFLLQGAGGPGGWALLDHEVSAATAACLLVRRSAYLAVGGMDEIFASGFNDVDLCMKLRAAGHEIIFSAHAELFHYESQSYGHHYTGDNAPRERLDAELIWRRWGETCRADPYYNPNLSLDYGNDWQLGFPPRAV